VNCCVRCFKDPEIKDIIKGCNVRGDCNFCGSTNVFTCDINNDDLKENFERLLDVYCPVSDIVGEFPREQADLMKNILTMSWDIFILKANDVYVFLKALLSEKYQEEPMLFDEPVWIKGSVQEEYLNQYSILGKYQWNDFMDEIKTKNRFHTTIINKEVFRKVLEVSCKEYEVGTEFFRARIWTEGLGFTIDEMGPPPSKKASAGRANPEGISCLYLADSLDTTLHETRAGVYDYATVGKFILKEKITIVDLTSIDKISPFLMVDIDLLAANLEHLRKIGDEISRPLRKHDSSLDYLPTQYICDYIKSIGYAGIKYKSTMCSDGMNFAIFYSELLDCVEVVDYDIDSLRYHYSKLH
jgi:hypothetical protein